MAQTLFLLNVALASFFLVQGLRKHGGYLEVPFLSALIYAIWFLPQAFVLLEDFTLPENSLARLLTMSLLCLIAVWAGWREGVRKSRTGKRIYTDVRLGRLVLPAILITLLAAAIRVAILAQPADVRASSQWTGPLTILSFFAQVGIVSLLLSVVLVLRRRSIVTLSLLGANLLLYAAPLLTYFRRGETFEFLFTVLLCLFFLRGKVIPRVLVVAGIVVGFAYVNGVGYLRALGGGYVLNEAGTIETRIPTLQEIMEIEWFDLDRFQEMQFRSETRNAAVYMAVVSDENAIGLGAGLWDRLVNAYVPGQILGHEFKESLHIGDDVGLLAQRSAGYEAHTGTTGTGFVALYYDFWFFGALVFYFVTKFMARHFAQAGLGSIESLALYAVLLPLSLMAITHFGYYVLVYAPLPVFSALLAFRYARKDPHHKRLTYVGVYRQQSVVQERRALPTGR